MVLFGDNYNEINFSDDGRQIILTFPNSSFIDVEEINTLGDIISYYGNLVFLQFQSGLCQISQDFK